MSYIETRSYQVTTTADDRFLLTDDDDVAWSEAAAVSIEVGTSQLLELNPNDTHRVTDFKDGHPVGNWGTW